uniref:Fucose mutarotase n=3 Tax=Cercopithecinae TaxID=9528 RepID=A0A2K5YE82_MANLE
MRGGRRGRQLNPFGLRELERALAKLERFEFYERAKKAFAVVATGPGEDHLGRKRNWGHPELRYHHSQQASQQQPQTWALARALGGRQSWGGPCQLVLTTRCPPGCLVLADLNFPASSICQCGPLEIRADGLGIPPLLEALLKLLPLDTYVESPAAVMELVPSDKERGLQTPVWTEYESILHRAGCTRALAKLERFEFYERAKKAFAVVATGETALYGNLILKKGVLALSPLL